MAKKSKVAVAFPFLLEELADSKVAGKVMVKPMFGAYAVYLDEKIHFILRQKAHDKIDSGIWVVLNLETRDSVLRDFPSLRKIAMFPAKKDGSPPTWMNLPATHPDFETTALAIAALVIRGDQRFGKVPLSAKKKLKAGAKMASSKKEPAEKPAEKPAKKPAEKTVKKPAAKKSSRDKRKSHKARK